MIKTSKPGGPSLRWYGLRIVLATIAGGIVYWPLDYNQIKIGSLAWPWGLATFIIAAILSERDLQPTLLSGAACAFGVPLAVILRVIVDVSGDPTSHNLWPFEVVLAAMISLPSGVLGAILGRLVRRAFSNRPQ